jgi:hypothetical protein
MEIGTIFPSGRAHHPHIISLLRILDLEHFHSEISKEKGTVGARQKPREVEHF